METIKRKIAALKEDVEVKDELISDLQTQLKNEKLEHEKSENEANSFKRKVWTVKIELNYRLFDLFFRISTLKFKK